MTYYDFKHLSILSISKLVTEAISLQLEENVNTHTVQLYIKGYLRTGL